MLFHTIFFQNSTVLLDHRGKEEIHATQALVEFIKGLTEHFLSAQKQNGTDIPTEKIFWVFVFSHHFLDAIPSIADSIKKVLYLK